MNRRDTHRRLLAASISGLLLALTIPCGATPPPTPLVTVELEPDKARHILFPQPIRLGMPATSALQAEVLEEHLWLSAPDLRGRKERLLVHSADPTRRWILEVSTSRSTAGTGNLPPYGDSLHIGSAAGSDRHRESHWHHVRLVRWAFQQLYSPRRLLSQLPGTRRYPLKSTALRLMRCSPTDRPACPLIYAALLTAWRYSHSDTGTLYLIAAELHNTGSSPVRLSPERLRGDWLSVSFSQRRLAVAGRSTDNAVVLLISRRPPSEALSL